MAYRIFANAVLISAILHDVTRVMDSTAEESIVTSVVPPFIGADVLAPRDMEV